MSRVFLADSLGIERIALNPVPMDLRMEMVGEAAPVQVHADKETSRERFGRGFLLGEEKRFVK